jgi:hypothetical protein
MALTNGFLNCGPLTFKNHFNIAAGKVPHPPFETECQGQIAGKCPEEDSLDPAFDDEMGPCLIFHD